MRRAYPTMKYAHIMFLDVACPSTYHEFEGPEAIPYDTEGTSIAPALP